mmetsp:Transcript_32340/g.57879  ORF Transcript_32340/g.57879 Transcript_32340/m.57879 type:complete len:121 (-) Transcript_32340:108-470(-)|eukprot:CAMPEP_0177760520 /NCGR_PEP_ID=MMETSP0491_2-20121128/5309_1 /TAXON_ID=63592 /ORGANISM="Tetraselmis chuii, Strain PLY429" /LENGTH=120 /DNA_ID=CAMNT_0019276421 /DNA_START=228 /DNA_END=590 /DNA_ORIENTATION=-
MSIRGSQLSVSRRIALTNNRVRAVPVAPCAVASGLRTTTAAPAPRRLSTTGDSSRAEQGQTSALGSSGDQKSRSCEEEHIEATRAKFRALRKLTASSEDDGQHGMYCSHIADRLATEYYF